MRRGDYAGFCLLLLNRGGGQVDVCEHCTDHSMVASVSSFFTVSILIV